MKYMIKADIKVNGTVQRKDIIGAIMGQTEGLLGDELELRKLQRTARVGHVDVEMETKGGKVHGMILIPSSMDNVETAIIGSALETIDRIGPCQAKISVVEISDVRATKRTAVVDRAKELLLALVNSGEAASKTVVEEVRSVLTVGTATNFHGLTCGPNVQSSDSLIIVEGRNDVINLLNCGVKNAISADGAGNIKQELIDLANGKQSVTLAIDGDRGGESGGGSGAVIGSGGAGADTGGPTGAGISCTGASLTTGSVSTTNDLETTSGACKGTISTGAAGSGNCTSGCSMIGTTGVRSFLWTSLISEMSS